MSVLQLPLDGISTVNFRCYIFVLLIKYKETLGRLSNKGIQSSKELGKKADPYGLQKPNIKKKKQRKRVKVYFLFFLFLINVIIHSLH